MRHRTIIVLLVVFHRVLNVLISPEIRVLGVNLCSWKPRSATWNIRHHCQQRTANDRSWQGLEYRTAYVLLSKVSHVPIVYNTISKFDASLCWISRL